VLKAERRIEGNGADSRLTALRGEGGDATLPFFFN
jgi:hypothetical protein